jgi:hypothetical protein
MRKYILVSFIIFHTPCIYGQNLITNPGFENGTIGWSPFWSRTANAGSADVVDSQYHSGTHSLHIKHWGKQDWSFGFGKSFPVKSGQYYEFSSYVNVQNLKDWSELSVILYDSAKSVISWSYGAVRFQQSSQGFVQYSGRFIIPDNVKYITPRFIGGDTCELFFDDVELYLRDSLTGSNKYFLENNKLSLSITLPSFTMDIYDKINKIKYTTQSAYIARILKIDSSKNNYTFNCIYLPDNFNISIGFTIRDEDIRINLSADSSSSFTSLIQFPGKISSRENDYLIVPRATGVISSVKDKFPFGDFLMYAWKSTMSFVGVTNLTTGYMIVSDDPWDTYIQFTKSSNENYFSPQIIHKDEKGKFGHDRTMFIVPAFNNGYVEMCRWYRNHVKELGYLKSFKQKIIENPNVEKLFGAVDFWALNNNFRTSEFLDSLINYGIDKAIISLGGSWYNPLDLSRIIDSINNKGLLSSRYDIYTDVWPPTHPEWNWFRTEGYPDDIIVKKDGSLQEGWLSYVNRTIPFQGYVACSQTHTKYAEKWISEDLGKNKYNCRFIDVELAASLYECYSPHHPLGRKQDAFYRIQLLDKVKNRFNLVTGSEEARDFAFPVCDFGEGTMTIRPADNAGYDWSTPLSSGGIDYESLNVNPAIRVPLHGLVYHDVHVPTWYTGDGVSKVPSVWDDKDLLNILYASMPLFMPPDYNYWFVNKEKFITSYHLISSISRSTGLEQMTDHKMLSGNWKVQQTSFSNGWKVTANFDLSPFIFGDKTIPSKGFYASNGSDEVYRLEENNKTIAVAKLSDRIFINTYGNEFIKNGIRVNGSVFMKKLDDHLDLSFIGSQKYIDINPDMLPWSISNLKVFIKNNPQELQTEKLSDGWIRINKYANNIFYRIEGKFINTIVNEKPEANALSYIKIFPNPFNSSTNIKYAIKSKTHVSMELFNTLGQTVKTLVDEEQNEGTYNINFTGSNLPSGIYICQLKIDGHMKIVKLLLIK